MDLEPRLLRYFLAVAQELDDVRQILHGSAIDGFDDLHRRI